MVPLSAVETVSVCAAELAAARAPLPGLRAAFWSAVRSGDPARVAPADSALVLAEAAEAEAVANFESAVAAFLACSAPPSARRSAAAE